MDIADRVAILNCRRIQLIGRPDEVRTVPAAPFVKAFLK